MKHEIEDVQGHEGLGQCRVCKSAEGEIPTHCPGREMTPAEKQDVYDGRLNYVGDEWVLGSNKAPTAPSWWATGKDYGSCCDCQQKILEKPQHEDYCNACLNKSYDEDLKKVCVCPMASDRVWDVDCPVHPKA